MERCKNQSRAQARIDTDGYDDRSTPRGNADAIAVGEAVMSRVVGRDVERLATPKRRRITAALHAGVEGIQAPASRQTNRIFAVERFDRRIVFDDGERRRCTAQRLLPEASVQELLARMVLVITRPRNTVELVEALVRHPGVPGRERAALIPCRSRAVFRPVAF